MVDDHFENLPPERRRDKIKALAKRYATVPLSVRTSDLPKRAASAVMMVLIAGGALLLGGLALDMFIALVAVATFAEFARLITKATSKPLRRILGLVAGALYIGSATYFLIADDPLFLVGVVCSVIFVDTFAYFAGRTFGGPKIAPRISPSKTWAGLIGGVIGAALSLGLLPFVISGLCRPYFDFMDSFEPPLAPGVVRIDDRCHFGPPPFDLQYLGMMLLIGAVIAVVAQSGDFLESWLRRKAGVKDSSNLIPGHGGVFDRTDGLIAVAIVAGLWNVVAT